MGDLDDAIKMEKAIKEMISQVAANEAMRLDALIMGYGVDMPEPDPASTFMGYQVIKSRHVPDDAIYAYRAPELKFTSEITIRHDSKYATPILTFGWKFESLPLFYGDYVGLADRLEIKLFSWPRYLALSLLVISLIVIMLLVAR